MVGIYKITNKINGKIYIGQSTNIMKRWNQHYLGAFLKDSEQNNLLHKAIKKYGVTNFYFEIEELCDIEDLNKKEIEYIKFYNSLQPNGYNIVQGGNNRTLTNEDNPNAKLTNLDVYNIREDYKKLLQKAQVYEKYKDKISYNTFSDIWVGKTWINIHCDVYTPENKKFQKDNYDKFKAKQKVSKLSLEDIITIRNLKNQLYARKEVYEQFSQKMNFHVFNDIWYYRTFPDVLPTVQAIAGKRRRSSHSQDGTKNPVAKFTKEQIIDIRQQKNQGKKIKKVYLSQYKDVCTFATFRRAWNGETYKDIII